MPAPGLVSVHPLSALDRALPVVSVGAKQPLPSTTALPCDTGSGGTRVPVPSSAGERGPCPLLPALCPGRSMSRKPPPGRATWMRGILCCNPILSPQNKPGASGRRSQGCEGERGLSCVGKNIFLPFPAAQPSPRGWAEPGGHQPAAACARDTLQLPLLMTFFPQETSSLHCLTNGVSTHLLAFSYVFLYPWPLLNPGTGRVPPKGSPVPPEQEPE